MLQATPNSFFSWDFTVSTGGQVIADVDMSWFRERATLEIDGYPYDVYRESILAGRFVMTSAGETLAVAEKPSAFLRRFRVDCGDRQFELQARSPFTRRFGVYEQDTLIGTIEPAGWLTRRATIELPDDIHVAIQVFMFWLVLILWRRAANSSSGAAGGA